MFDTDERDRPDGRPLSTGERRFLVVFCMLMFGGFAAELFADFEPVRLSALFFFTFWILLTFVHEAGHALVARALGWRVERIELGFGRVISQFSVAGVPVEVRAFPIVGLVSVVPSDLSAARRKTAAIYAAGPGIELLLAAAVGALIGFDVLLAPSASLLIIAAQSFALAAVLGAGLNLLPFSPRQGVITDGLGILQSPFWPRTFFEAMLVRPALREGVCLLDGGRPTEALACFEAALEAHPDLLVLHGACARALADLGRGEEALLRLQARVRVTPPDGRPEAEAVLDELRRYLRRGRDTGHRSG